MLSATLGITAATWAVAMAVAPGLQVREIVRRVRLQASRSRTSRCCSSVSHFGSRTVLRVDRPLVIPNALAFAVMVTTAAAAAPCR